MIFVQVSLEKALRSVHNVCLEHSQPAALKAMATSRHKRQLLKRCCLAVYQLFREAMAFIFQQSILSASADISAF